MNFGKPIQPSRLNATACNLLQNLMRDFAIAMKPLQRSIELLFRLQHNTISRLHFRKLGTGSDGI